MKSPIEIYNELSKHEKQSVLSNLLFQFDGWTINKDFENYIDKIIQEGYPNYHAKKLAESALNEVALRIVVNKNLI